MKLQSQVSRRVQKKEYRKFCVVIPNEIIMKLGWIEGQEISPEVRGHTLILKTSRD
jgi:hypothetical protein